MPSTALIKVSSLIDHFGLDVVHPTPLDAYQAVSICTCNGKRLDAGPNILRLAYTGYVMATSLTECAGVLRGPLTVIASAAIADFAGSASLGSCVNRAPFAVPAVPAVPAVTLLSLHLLGLSVRTGLGHLALAALRNGGRAALGIHEPVPVTETRHVRTQRQTTQKTQTYLDE